MTSDIPATALADVIVIGGGAAGLSGAVTLGRSRRSVTLIDGGEPRNAPAAHAHNYLTRDGASPLEILRIGREEARSYGVELVDAIATHAERTADGFAVSLADGTVVRGRRILVTTGLRDVLPDIEGLAQRWGKDVLHCPYCHGWETRDRTVGIIGGAMSAHSAPMWRQLTEDVTVFAATAPEFSAEELERFAARGISIEHEAIARLEVEDDALVALTLADGRRVPMQALVVAPQFATRSEVLESLGVTASEMKFGDHVIGTYVESDPMGATSQAGVFVAGNVTSPMDTVVAAAAAGVRAGSSINVGLIEDDVTEAVAARRAGVR